MPRLGHNTTVLPAELDHHTVAAIALGGQHGPLRLLTRTVTYSIVFGVGYGIGLGPVFGLASGLAAGITLSIELNREARRLRPYSLAWEGVFSAIRGIAFGAGLYRIVGLQFAVAFATLSTIGQIFAYSRGIRPGMDYTVRRGPHLSRRQFWGTVVRTVGYIATALICSAFVHHVDHPISFALRVGLVTGIVTGVGQTVIPYIEYFADNLPERALGVFGIGLILCGFALQSLQYWLSLLDVRVT
jgi:hypothetical protein